MSFQELTQFINRYQVHSYSKPYRHFVLKASDFEKIKHWFEPTKTWFYWWRPTWRSQSRWWHWHAVKFDEFVELHCDFGNFNHSYALGIIHFFCDTLGYMLWCLLRHGKPWHHRDFAHLKAIKTQHPFHLVNVFSARVHTLTLGAQVTNILKPLALNPSPRVSGQTKA